MFATMRRKRRSAMMKQELGQSVDHFKRAATLAAQETSATVGPVSSLSRAISPDWFIPISTTQTLAVGLALHSVSGTPQKLLKLLGLA